MSQRTLLVDDEPLALQRLRRLLAPHSAQIDIIGEAQDGETAVEQIDRLQPELVLLDIQMPPFDGFQVLARIRHRPWIVFCTAYDAYALEAFEAHTLDYLLKPVAPERLAKTLEKLQRLTAADQRAFSDQLDRLVEQVRPAGRRRLQARQGDRIRLLEAASVHFFRAADKYVEAHTADGVFLLDQSLVQLEDELPTDDFVRIHRSIVVNLDWVDEIRRLEDGTYRVRLADGAHTELPVSRRAQGRLGL